MRILFTGGGTGGHIYPIIAVAEELQLSANRDDLELHYFGAPGPFAKLLQENGILVSRILSAKMRRYFDVRNFYELPIIFPLTVIQALWKVFWLMPDVLFSKGGPGSLPVVFACHFYRVPIIIHDSDSMVGLSNQAAVRWADRVALSFNSAIEPLLEKFSAKGGSAFGGKNSEKMRAKIALVGNPIRRSLTGGIILQKDAAKKLFMFDSQKPMVLVIAGSQGSVKLNDFFIQNSEELIKDFQILHQTGIKNFDDAKKELDMIMKTHSEQEKARYKMVAYFEKDLDDAYAAADLVVSRGSAGAIFEIAAFGKPSVLIPLSADVVGEHQINNAYEYVKTGAGIVIEEENLTPNLFISQLKNLFSEPEKLSQMSQAAKNFAKPEAAKTIAEEILKLGI